VVSELFRGLAMLSEANCDMDTTSVQSCRSDLENNETTNSTNVDVGGNSGTQINMKRKREEQENHETTNSTNVDVGGNSGTQINMKRKREEHETCSEGRMENTTSETGSSDHHETTNSAKMMTTTTTTTKIMIMMPKLMDFAVNVGINWIIVIVKTMEMKMITMTVQITISMMTDTMDDNHEQ
jgi:hypothetical protein